MICRCHKGCKGWKWVRRVSQELPVAMWICRMQLWNVITFERCSKSSVNGGIHSYPTPNLPSCMVNACKSTKNHVNWVHTALSVSFFLHPFHPCPFSISFHHVLPFFVMPLTFVPVLCTGSQELPRRLFTDWGFLLVRLYPGVAHALAVREAWGTMEGSKQKRWFKDAERNWK